MSSKHLEALVEEWVEGGIVDASTAARIRDWDSRQQRSTGLRWPVLIALAFGALLLGAGILLLVSANWEQLSPGQRITLVMLIMTGLHAGGAVVADRSRALSITLHTLGTITLGGAIAVAGDVLHLSEYWAQGYLLWAAGSAIAWALLRHWTQATLTAFLAPLWLSAEWIAHVYKHNSPFVMPVALGVCALSFVYLSARRGPEDSALLKSLGWLGGIALLPAVGSVIATAHWTAPDLPGRLAGWQAAIAIPLGVALVLRGRQAVWSGLAILWTIVLAAAAGQFGSPILAYVWCAAGASGLALWGVRERRPERINLGIAGFAITVLAFYASNVMDKIGRSASLIAIGMLFLAGGWLLEQTRRNLMERIRTEAI